MSNASADHDVNRERAALYALGALAGDERAAFEAHLKTCSECAADVAASAHVTQALNQSVPQHDPPAALRGRVLTAVTGQGTSSRGQPRASVVPLPPPKPAVRFALAPWLSLAAALVLVAGLAVYTASLRTQVSDLEGRLISAVARIDESARQAEEATRLAQAAQAPLPVLTAPDLARIDLAGQPAAPSASARAYWSRSRGLVLTAANLPAPPGGKTYQLWVLAGNQKISVGLLKPDTAGQANIVFNTPADIPQPTGMALTDEPEGGLPQPSGSFYLLGSAH